MKFDYSETGVGVGQGAWAGRGVIFATLRLQVTKSLAPLVGCKARCLFLTSVVLFLIRVVLP